MGFRCRGPAGPGVLAGVLLADGSDQIEVVGDDSGDAGVGELPRPFEVIDGPGEDERGVVAKRLDGAGVE